MTASPAPPQLTPKARRPSRRHRSAATGSWLVSLSLAFVATASVLLLAPLFVVADWVPDVVVMAAVVCGASAVLRALTGSHALATAAGWIGAAVALVWAVHPDGPGDIGPAIAETAAEIVQQLGSDVPPLRSTRASLVLVLLVTALATLFAELCVFVFRGRVLGLLPFAPFPVLPVLFGAEEGGIRPHLALAGSVAFYLFAVTQWHTRISDEDLADQGSIVDDRGAGGWRGSIVVTAAAAALALTAAVALPAPAGLPQLANLGPASLATNRSNPIIDLGSDLRRPDPVQVMRYLTTVGSGPLPYFTLVSLTELDGDREWAPAEFTGDVEVSEQLPPPPGLGDAASTAAVEANIVLEPGVSPYLPQPGAARGVAELEGGYLLDRETGNIRSEQGDAAGQRYQISTIVPQAAPEAVSAAPLTVPEELRPLTELPEGEASERIRSVLEGIVDPQAPPYEQARQLQRHFAEGGFEYSLTTPLQDGYDGSNLSVVATFLDVRSGYCVHFASAMAVMGRMLGIPTRIQVGFTPGSPIGPNEAGQLMYGVSSDNLHAWAELYVPGWGWLPFETTPSSGLGNLMAAEPGQPAPPQPEQSAPATAVPSHDPEAAQTLAATQGPEQSPEPSDEPVEAGAANRGGAGAGGTPGVLAAIAGLLLLLFSPALLRAFVRRRRRGLVAAPRTTGPPAAAIAWRELLDQAVDLGRPVPPGAAPRVQERRLGELLAGAEAGETGGGAAAAPAGQALRRLRIALERSLFAQPDRPQAEADLPGWADVAEVERAMAAQLPASARLRARLLPASLRRRSRRRTGP